MATNLKEFHRQLLKAKAAGYTRISYVCREMGKAGEVGGAVERVVDANVFPLWAFLTPADKLCALGKRIATTGESFAYEFLN